MRRRITPHKRREYDQRYNRRHRAAIAERLRRWRKRNPEHVRARARLSYARNKEREKLRCALWQRANKDQVNRQRRDYYRRHKAHLNAVKAVWRARNANKQSIYNRRFYLQHRNEIRLATASWGRRNRNKVNQAARKRWILNRDQELRQQREHRRINKDRINRRWRAWSKYDSSVLGDNYVKSVLTSKSDLSRKGLPVELVDFKREQLRLLRAIKSIKTHQQPLER